MAAWSSVHIAGGRITIEFDEPQQALEKLLALAMAISNNYERFERQGSNLYASVPINFSQAALGAEITVQSLNGQQQIKIPAGTQTGTIFRLKGQGMPVLGGRGRGDLFVAVAVVTPTTLTREQRRILEQLAEVETKDLEDKGLIDKVRNIFG